MTNLPEAGVFKQPPSRMEAKNDATTRAARDIIDREVSARVAKTERLRAARLAQEAEAEQAAPPEKKTVRRKKAQPRK